MSSACYKITHQTIYHYNSPVSASYGQAHLLPRETSEQHVVSAELSFLPAAQDYRERTDFFGNRAAYFAIDEPHTQLAVVATSVVEVAEPALLLAGQAAPWEVLRDRLATARGRQALEVAPFALASPRIQPTALLADYARSSFAAGRPLGEAVRSLAARIHRDFAFQPGATHVASSLEEVMAARRGVCQDFAHVAIGCLRSLGLAARYVSGYLETNPPPGQAKLLGADASHAWLAVWTGAEPGAGPAWAGVDPTNDQLANDRYVVTAWGRDYDDVAPLKGVIQTEGSTTKLDVTVDVVRRPD